MTISRQATLVMLSPNNSGMRTHEIDTVTIHHCAGNIKMRALGNMFAQPSRRGSANYGIGSDGTVACFVPEELRSWCSNSEPNDQRAITIEVANSDGAPEWPISSKAYNALIALLADIVRRNPGMRGSLRWAGDSQLINQIDVQNITLHKWLYPTACPGPYLERRMPDIVRDVNALLTIDPKIYTIQVGAYHDRGNAERMLRIVRTDYPDAFIKEVIQ